MTYLRWLLKAAVFLALFAFAVGNRHDVDLHLLAGYTWHVPLVLLVLGSLSLGALLGVAASWSARRSARPEASLTAPHPAPDDDAVV